MKELIEVQVDIKAPIELVWRCFTEPEHIVNWYYSMDNWHTPRAINDLSENGKFKYRMESKDGSMGFDFTGRNIKIDKHELIRYLLEDGRRVDVKFKTEDGKVIVSEDFEAQSDHTIHIEKDTWQKTLDNFKFYVENQNKKIS